MTKPRHKIAVLLWLLGLAVLLFWTRAMFNFVHDYPARVGNSRGLVLAVVAGAVLIAIGTIIELWDRIRWKTLPLEARGQSASAWTFLRRGRRLDTD